MENANSEEYLKKIRDQVIANLRQTAHAPSVQSTEIPRTTITGGTEEDDDILADRDEDENADVRMTEQKWDKKVTRDDELYESDDEDGIHTNGMVKPNGAPRQRNIMDYSAPAGQDEDTEMETIPTPTVPATVAVTEANAEVIEEVMKQKARELVESAEVGPSNAPSRAHSQRQTVDGEGDVTMEAPTEQITADAPAEPAIVNAPLSPAASVPTSVPATAEPVVPSAS
jgi:histone deacetylase 1/2